MQWTDGGTQKMTSAMPGKESMKVRMIFVSQLQGHNVTNAWIGLRQVGQFSILIGPAQKELMEIL